MNDVTAAALFLAAWVTGMSLLLAWVVTILLTGTPRTPGKATAPDDATPDPSTHPHTPAPEVTP